MIFWRQMCEGGELLNTLSSDWTGFTNSLQTVMFAAKLKSQHLPR